ncbi:hypothetical protein B0H13DRAFT_1909274 [Mycena leptocephala]|nr:hypothetical protein B0H13DRAFT_1909274 [Mycena leptocephala]
MSDQTAASYVPEIYSLKSGELVDGGLSTPATPRAVLGNRDGYVDAAYLCRRRNQRERVDALLLCSSWRHDARRPISEITPDTSPDTRTGTTRPSPRNPAGSVKIFPTARAENIPAAGGVDVERGAGVHPRSPEEGPGAGTTEFKTGTDHGSNGHGNGPSVALPLSRSR